MSPQNRPLKITGRIVAALVLIGLIHLIALLIWRNDITTRLSGCHLDGYPWPVCKELRSATMFDFYSQVGEYTVVWVHVLALILLVCGFFALLLLAGLLYWLTTGKNLLDLDKPKDEPSSQEDEDDFVPCKDPECQCASHQNEEFVTQWQLKS